MDSDIETKGHDWLRGWINVPGGLLTKKGAQDYVGSVPAIAYGERGAGPIPPNATLNFEIELLDIKR